MSEKLCTILFLLDANRQYGNPPVGRTVLVKQVYFAELLRPSYESWCAAFQFVRYYHGPYSDAIVQKLDQLIFSGLVDVKDFSAINGRVIASYETTKEGSQMAEYLEPKNRNLASLCRDLVWALQAVGAVNRRAILQLAYQEPLFVDVLRKDEGSGIPASAKTPLPQVNSSHPSFRIQSLLVSLGTKYLNGFQVPRELVREYLLHLAVRSHRAAPQVVAYDDGE